MAAECARICRPPDDGSQSDLRARIRVILSFWHSSSRHMHGCPLPSSEMTHSPKVISRTSAIPVHAACLPTKQSAHLPSTVPPMISMHSGQETTLKIWVNEGIRSPPSTRRHGMRSRCQRRPGGSDRALPISPCANPRLSGTLEAPTWSHCSLRRPLCRESGDPTQPMSIRATFMGRRRTPCGIDGDLVLGGQSRTGRCFLGSRPAGCA
jgi:hypothetical protein